MTIFQKIGLHIRVKLKEMGAREPHCINDAHHGSTPPPLDTNRRRDLSLSPSNLSRKTKDKDKAPLHSRRSSVTFPDGAIPEEYGLPPITRYKDVEGLQKFELIRYLDGFNMSHEGKTEDEMKTYLKGFCTK
ncbi:uncharacterized protein LODBEIA_P14930 [Lodderomyces beijingensis]|uniref:Mug135-like C-terminal domain-containing protein n=1 Tax=Lodderomyces beijingensis TaxID=1775926 RepID=A0ABP0ZGH5_9ASCO